jgi:AcrR family transcriptional regulator
MGLPSTDDEAERIDAPAPRGPITTLLKAGAEPPPASKLDRVLNAAQEEFFEQGYSHAKVESIAKRGRVATATIYAYFPAKADLFHAVVTRTLSGGDPVGDALARHRTDDARGRLMAFAMAYAAVMSTAFARGLFRGIVAEQPQFPALAQESAEQAYRLTSGHLVTLIEELRAGGDLAIAEPPLAAAQLQGMLDHPTLIVGLLYGDEAAPTIALPHLCEESVEMFLARYGTR